MEARDEVGDQHGRHVVDGASHNLKTARAIFVLQCRKKADRLLAMRAGGEDERHGDHFAAVLADLERLGVGKTDRKIRSGTRQVPALRHGCGEAQNCQHAKNPLIWHKPTV
ncbi:MAG: hypothetical protein ABSH50_13105 [Bryobacteraceae bacterium]